MARSSEIETSWTQWRAYFFFVGLSLVLLIFEQGNIGLIFWDWARASAHPGQAVVQSFEAVRLESRQWLEWRAQVLQRLAQVEYNWHQEVLKSAELTETITSLQAQLPQTTPGNPSLQSALRLDEWQRVVWEGVPGAWQIRAGCLQGLERGDPVVTQKGVLMGTVGEVQRSYSTVDSWDSTQVTIPVRVGTPSAAAVAHGSANGVTLSHLAWPSEVKNGDSVFSAGSNLVPRGLVVGSIFNLQGQEVFGEATAQINTPLALTQAEFVLIPPKSGATCGQ